MMADGLISSSLVGQEAANSPEPLTYCYHKDVDLLFKVKIDELEGELSSGSEAIDSADLYVVVTLYDGGQPLCASSYSTRCKSRPKNTSGVTWTDWIVMPIAVSDMPLDTLLCFTVWSSTSKDPVGGTTCYVFSTTGQLKRGQRRLQLHEGVPADGSDPSTTLGKVTKRTFESRTDKLLQRYKLHQINKIAWLDTLTFRQVTKLQHEVNERNPGPQALLARARQSQPYDSAPRHPILVVSFPRLPVPVFHQSLAGPIPASYPAIPQTGLVSIRDPEMDEIDNPCEVKAVKIMKYHHLVVDPDIKPNTGQYTKIQATLRGSPLKAPSTEECHLLWQFRYFLWKKKIGFTRFMRCVDWADAQELKEAVKMVPGWSGLTLENCLELLSAPFKGVNPVRQHAVKRLREETTETLMTILLQLVQALRYEDDALQSSLFELLTERAHENWELCSHFFWYSKVELHGSPESSALFSRVNDHYIEALRAQKPSFAAQIDKQLELMGCFTKLHESTLGKNSDRKARVQDAIRDGACGIAQCFHGYAPHEAGAKDSAKAGGLMTGLGKQFAAARASVVNLGATYSKSYDDPDDKLEDSISELPGVSTPLFPDIGLVGMRPDAHIFSSAKRPMALTCVKTDGELERVMFKAGDDIRQDQLVLQIINIMNELLLQDGLDLKLTPYRCLATSANDGLMEMVPDVVVLQTIYLNIHNYLRKYNYDEKGDFQLTNKCLDTWVRSNAGYAIITFILGIGDRHLENLLVTKDGRILHIDFGFILGRDPKPFPPPLKLSKEMVDAMGGRDSARFNEFKKLCCSAYTIIRKHSALIINVLAMMIDAGINDVTADVRTTKNPYAKIQSVEDKLRLYLNDAEATTFFLEIINEAVNSLFGRMHDWMHKTAVAFRPGVIPSCRCRACDSSSVPPYLPELHRIACRGLHPQTVATKSLEPIRP